MDKLEKQNVPEEGLVDYLAGFLTEERRALFARVLGERTRRVTVVLEDIFDPHNASAVLRSCDCFGVQEAHVVEIRNQFRPNKDVDKGAAKWVDVHRYDAVEKCYEALKGQGYVIAATTPHTELSLSDLPLDKPVALAFGSELPGLTDWALEHADYRVKIPMYGFTESFNISVSAALALRDLVERLRRGETDWRLSEAERAAVRFRWIERSLRNPQGMAEAYYKKHKQT